MKTKKTFTIDEKLWKKFEIISNKLSINKSLYFENCIKKLIKENDNSENDKI
jgi:hypothetical protein